MEKIYKEENPIWDEFKNRLFNIDNQGAFSYSHFEIGSKLNCYCSLIYSKDNIPYGIATLNPIAYDYGTECLEINVAVDKKNNTQSGIGTALLQEAEKIVSQSPYNKIIAIIKSTNSKREEVSEWFYKRDYHIQGILNQDTYKLRSNFYKAMFLIGDLTLSKTL